MDKCPPIYFDNAASSHPKPETVYIACDHFLRQGGSPGRSAHQFALVASRQVFETRIALASFLGVNAAERLVFTPGCTQSLNMVLFGIDWQPGDLIYVSALEHNAVMRPLEHLRKSKNVVVETLPYSPGDILSAETLQRAIAHRKPRLCVFMEASNVTGEMANLQELSSVCHESGVEFLVDAAQSAGSFQLKLDKYGPTYWASAGHKGFFAAAGVGLLYVDPKASLSPLVYGGTGSKSEKLDMPDSYPDHLEPGTMNGAAIASLAKGLEFILQTGVENIVSHELSLCKMFTDWLANQKQMHVILPALTEKIGLVSFEIDGMDSARVAELLDREYGIAVRAGLHCAAAAHQTLGTSARGLVRASFGFYNSEFEVEKLCQALSDILTGKIRFPN